MGTHEDPGEINMGSFLSPKTLQFKVDHVVTNVEEIKQTQTVLSESINRFSEKQATMAGSIVKIEDKQVTMAESILKIQDSLLDSKVDEKFWGKVLVLLETSLRSFQTTLREIMVDPTAFKGAAVGQEARLLKVVAETTLQASQSIVERISKFLLLDNSHRKLPRLFS